MTHLNMLERTIVTIAIYSFVINKAVGTRILLLYSCILTLMA
ncbi:hypothetical protein PMIN01_12141 [Paraphaeosphaeria minitans]|uniref:Uncharacterized protein n=1 Tax=Paraphaeosphaeria minitans TaxID=565426 RepID=A0A9P6KK85_9PLEO|nr:hypothetical protein PMIN01_12141 [Paraphaeosphaeria minitans]